MRTIKLFFFSLLLISTSITAQAKEIKLLTSIKPLQLIAAAIQNGINKPDVLLPLGASAHHYSLKPNDLQRIQDADLFYWIGPNMEVFLTKTVQTRSKPSIAIQQLASIHLRHFSEEHEDHDDNDHQHQAGSLDPHLWLNPTNAITIATKMTEDLSKLDPSNKDKYQANLVEFQKDLNTTDKAIRHSFTHIKLKPFFVFHETYNYFEETYDIKHSGVFSLNASIQPSIKHVAEMKQRLAKAGDSCIFYEPPVKPKLADTLTQGLPVSVYMLDAMGAEIAMNNQGYPKLLVSLAEQLQACKQ